MNKTVLITGSTNLAKETIIKFAENNYNIVYTYLNHEKEALNLKEYISNKYNIEILCIKCDITNDNDIDILCNEIIKKFKSIDILVNNASIDITSDINDKNRENYLKILNTNLVSTFIITRKFAEIMYKNKKGSIINISSNNSIDDYNIYSLEYDSSKAALNNLSHNIANYYKPYVRVNTICPGWIETENTLNMNPNFIEEEKNKILLNRFAKPREVANLIYFLASDEASYINDSIIKIDGGKVC